MADKRAYRLRTPYLEFSSAAANIVSFMENNQDVRAKITPLRFGKDLKKPVLIKLRNVFTLSYYNYLEVISDTSVNQRSKLLT